MLMLKKQKSYCGRLVRVYCLGLDLIFIFVCRDSDRRSQLSANLDDLLQAFHRLDSTDELPMFYCEALHLLKLPPLSLDPIAEQVKLNLSVLKTLSSTIEELNHKISSLGNIQPPSASSSSYASAVSFGKKFATPSNTDTLVQDGKHNLYTVSSSQNNSSMSGRELNLILFGLQETGSIVESKQLVDEILLFITGRSIPIKDLFRLGKLARPSSGSSASSSGKPRPVLIKLMTAWNRRVVLYSK